MKTTTFLVACSVSLAACAAPISHADLPRPDAASAPPVATPADTSATAAANTTTTEAAPNGSEPTRAEDRCAEFNRRQNQLDPVEHQRRYGCPPCPCACVNGEIRCAPCARCVSDQGPDLDGPVPPPPGP